MAETPKRIKRLLREYAAVAHEEELRRALLPVAEAFKRWEREELDSGELSEIIHKFHQGPARDLWVRYNTDRKSTRLNSSHGYISYAVFCLKKKKKKRIFEAIQQRTSRHL